MSANLQYKKVIKTEGCWIWQGSLNNSGYGQHRRWYTRLVGKPKPGMHLDHLCGNRWCVNPEHLEEVTRKENLLRSPTISTINATKTHCSKGHPFNQKNTWYRKDRYGRQCKICWTESSSRRWKLIKAMRQVEV